MAINNNVTTLSGLLIQGQDANSTLPIYLPQFTAAQVTALVNSGQLQNGVLFYNSTTNKLVTMINGVQQNITTADL